VGTIFWFVGLGIPVIAGILSLLCFLVWNTQVSNSDLAKLIAINSQRLTNLETDNNLNKNQHINLDTRVNKLENLEAYRSSIGSR
jgi:hypothetical protein